MTDSAINAEPPIRIGLLLIDGFAMMSYAALIEPFRAANVLSGREVYAWRHLSVSGAPAVASNGARIEVDGRVGEPLDADMLFVFAGGNPALFSHAPTFAWLRRLARAGVAIGGVSGGPFLLARAGLLAGYRATIHWEHAPALMAAHPRLDLEKGLYVIDRRRITCAGGTAGLDLALALIGRDAGGELAARVGEWFIRTDLRDASGPQRPDAAQRHGTRNARVLAALAAMEAGLEQPLDRAALGRAAGLSLRQLERLFRLEMGEGMAAVALRLRLAAAAHALRTTGGGVTQVAMAFGFASAAHFARAFRTAYGLPPSRWRTMATNEAPSDLMAGGAGEAMKIS